MIKIKIVVCIKQVPGTTEIKINPETNTLIRENIESIINPFDTYAIEEGVRLKERLTGAEDSTQKINKEYCTDETEVISLTMGPPHSVEVLRESISLGIDKSVLLSDRAFAGADTWATAYTLSKAIRKIEGWRLIILGKQTLDGDTGQVGPELAQILNIPFIGYASSVIEINQNKMIVKRLMEDRYETIETRLPAAISVGKEINIPRVPSLRGKLRSKSAEIPVWDRNSLELNEDDVGLSGSFTQVIKIFTPQTKHETRMIAGNSEEQADELYKKFKEINII